MTNSDATFISRINTLQFCFFSRVTITFKYMKCADFHPYPTYTRSTTFANKHSKRNEQGIIVSTISSGVWENVLQLKLIIQGFVNFLHQPFMQTRLTYSKQYKGFLKALLMTRVLVCKGNGLTFMLSKLANCKILCKKSLIETHKGMQRFYSIICQGGSWKGTCSLVYPHKFCFDVLTFWCILNLSGGALGAQKEWNIGSQCPIFRSHSSLLYLLWKRFSRTIRFVE